MLPIVIYEDLVRLFNFYHDGAVRQGMSYRSRLYKLVRVEDANHRPQAYCFACGIAHQRVATVVTVSMQQYKVWVEVSAPIPAEIAVLPRYQGGYDKAVFPFCQSGNCLEAT